MISNEEDKRIAKAAIHETEKAFYNKEVSLKSLARKFNMSWGGFHRVISCVNRPRLENYLALCRESGLDPVETLKKVIDENATS